MNIAFVSIINNSYISYFKVMLNSLLVNNKDFNLDFIVLYDGNFSENEIRDIKKVYNKVKFVKIKNELLSNDRKLSCHRSKEWKNNNYSVFSRFEIFDLEEYNKLIYLDTDLVVHNNLDFLIKECNESECYAVKHEYRNIFNAGVMVINKKTSFKDYKDRCIKIIDKIESCTGNQSILNECFAKTKNYIPSKYNLTVLHSDVDAVLKNNESVILHFPGNKKPWDKEKFSNYYGQANKKVKEEFVKIWEHYNNLINN